MTFALWMLTREKYQNLLAKRAAKYLSEKLHTKVSIDHVSLSFFNQFNFQGVYIEDNAHDTLAYVGSLQIKTSELLSNYWNNSRPVIHDITLENVYVHMNRDNDSVWNYDFIANAFNAPSKTKTTSDASDQQHTSNPELDIKKIACHNIRVFMNDGWRGEDMNFTFATLSLTANEIDLIKKNIALNNILIDGAKIAVREYNGNKPKDLSPDDSSSWGTPFNPDNYKLTLQSLHLSGSSFLYQDGKPTSIPGLFDENNIDISQLSIDLGATTVVSDTIFSTINKLTATERSGIAIKQMNAHIKLSQIQTSLDQLNLVTNYSSVGDHYEMNYTNFHDFNDYIDKVHMKASLKNSSISTLDIGYFANIMNKYPIAVDVAGEVDGTVATISGKNLSLGSLHTRFQGDATITGLPDIDNTLFDITSIDATTSGNDLNALIPQTKTSGIAWNKLSTIEYKGSYEGMVSNFYTKGTLNTNLGNAAIDLNMDFKPEQPTYQGHIETASFDIGQFIKQSQLGKIGLNGKINGSGFDLDHLNTKVDAVVSSIEFEGNTYSDLTINGIVAKKKFDGIFISKDPGLEMNFNGIVDLSSSIPMYDFNARFIKFDFQKAGLTKDPIIGSGFVSLNFNGSTIDDMTGVASFKNLVVSKGNKTISLDDALLESLQLSNEKIVRLSSSVADAEIRGNFYVSGLPDAIQLYLYHYLPQYIQMPSKMSNQALKYNLTVKNIDTFMRTFFPEYSGLSGSVVSGNLNTTTQKFSLDANIASIGYNEFHFKNLAIVGAGDYTGLDLNATCDNFLYKEEVIIPSFQINAQMANDTASLSIVTQSINDILGDAYLNLKAVALNNYLYVSILPSSVRIKEDTWQLHGRDDLVFGKEITISDLIMESGAQKIVVNTKKSTSNDLTLSVNELDLQSFSSYANQTNPSFSGRISGEIEVDDFLDNPVVKASIFSTNEVLIDNDTLGFVSANITFDTKNEFIGIGKNTHIIRHNNKAEVRGSVNVKSNSINVKTSFDHTDISFLNQFVRDYVTDMNGSATGVVNIKGTLDKPDISGNIVISNASIKVTYLGTKYSMDDIKMHVTSSIIQLDDFTIKDERKGNFTGIVSGHIDHKNFADVQLDLNVTSPNLLCLNTMEWDNDLFYGYVPAKLNANVKGYLDDITLDVTTKPLKGSKFHMPISSSGDASSYDYISFSAFGKSQNALTSKKTATYFKLNLNIEATPAAEVYIILDKNTREQIVAKGNGDLGITFDMGNSMNMFGTYVITEGKYEFNFRGVLPRTFTIDEGSKIVWNGDPLGAMLDVNAVYKLPNSLPLYPLIAGLNITEKAELDESKKKYDTYLYLSLQHELSRPEIKFDIAQPSNKAIGTLAYDKLVQIKNDERELVSQAGILLLLGEFKGSEIKSSYERGGVATASDLISNALSSGLTNVFSEVTGLKNFSLNLGYNSYSTNSDQANNINQFKFGVSANLFKDRVVVDFGSNVDVDRNNISTKGANSVNVGGDFKAQYLVTSDGRLRLNAYRSPNYNVDGTNVMKGGVGVSYKKVFNNFRELFTSKRRKYKQKITDSVNKTES